MKKRGTRTGRHRSRGTLRMFMALSGWLPVILLVAVCTGCSGRTSMNPDGSSQAVLDAGRLVIGIDINYPPMGYMDENGEVTGFDIDVAREVCDRLGIELVVQAINWDEKEKELNEGRIDCIWNGLSVNAERRSSMCLSEPYMKNELVFLVRENGYVKSVSQLKGKKVGVQKGSTAQSFFETSEVCAGMDEFLSSDNVTLIRMLEAGELDAVLIDSIVAYHYLMSNDSEKSLMIFPRSIAQEDFAIAFRKSDTALCDMIQGVLKEMRLDGTLAAISTRWFGTDITTIK